MDGERVKVDTTHSRPYPTTPEALVTLLQLHPDPVSYVVSLVEYLTVESCVYGEGIFDAGRAHGWNLSRDHILTVPRGDRALIGKDGRDIYDVISTATTYRSLTGDGCYVMAATLPLSVLASAADLGVPTHIMIPLAAVALDFLPK